MGAVCQVESSARCSEATPRELGRTMARVNVNYFVWEDSEMKVCAVSSLLLQICHLSGQCLHVFQMAHSK